MGLFSTCTMYNVDSRLEHWTTTYVPLQAGIQHFVVSATRGGEIPSEDEGDIAIDDFKLERRACQNSNNNTVKNINVHILK